MRKTISLLMMLSGFLLLGGCALVPEKLNLNPKVDVPRSNIGKNHKVSVKVIDVRDSTIIGGRASGYGPAASIKLASNLSRTLERAIYKGLRNKNFVPVGPNVKTARQLTVRITGLSYKQRAGFLSASIDVSFSMEAQAKNKSDSFDRVYRNQKTSRILVTPTTTSDTNKVNGVISQVVNKMLNDRTLIELLAK